MKIDFNLCLIGMPCSGKTSIAKIISETTTLLFKDTDIIIENKYKKPISKLFYEYGEEFFRKIEEETLRSITMEEKNKKIILSTGGGILKSKQNKILIKKHFFVFYIKVDSNIIINRLRNNQTRPNVIRQISYESLEKRIKSYEECSHIKIQSNNLTTAEIANLILSNL